MAAPAAQVLADRATAAYLGLAIGDALGATVEFMTPREIRAQYHVHKEMIGGGWLKLRPGRITDDTEMSLALGSAILSSHRIEAESIARAFSDWMRGKPVDIGNTVRRGIVHYRNKGKTSVAKNDYNAGNGACMRCLPIALATFGADDETVVRASRVQAHITHHADLSDAGTEHVIRLLQMAMRGRSLSELETFSRAFCREHDVFDFNRKPEENPSGFIVHTLRAVFQAFYAHGDFESCLIDVVNRGGDADTTGAILGMLAGAYYGTRSLPKRWLKRLDTEVARQCRGQASALLGIAPVEIVAEEGARNVAADSSVSDQPAARST